MHRNVSALNSSSPVLGLQPRRMPFGILRVHNRYIQYYGYSIVVHQIIHSFIQDYPLQCEACFHIGNTKYILNTCFDHICHVNFMYGLASQQTRRSTGQSIEHQAVRVRTCTTWTSIIIVSMQLHALFLLHPRTQSAF